MGACWAARGRAVAGPQLVCPCHVCMLKLMGCQAPCALPFLASCWRTHCAAAGRNVVLEQSYGVPKVGVALPAERHATLFVQLDAAGLEPSQRLLLHQQALRRLAMPAKCHEESCCCLMPLIAPLPEQMSFCRSSTMESPLRVPSSWRIPLRMLAPSSSRRSVGLLQMCHWALEFCIPKKLCFRQTSHAPFRHDSCFAAGLLSSSLHGRVLLSTMIDCNCSAKELSCSSSPPQLPSCSTATSTSLSVTPFRSFHALA